MSSLLESLGVRTAISFGSKDAVQSAGSVPGWVEFLMWTGWWMRRHRSADRRLFMVLLLPTRSCCSVFSAFGALVGSMSEDTDVLTWSTLAALPSGQRVYLRFKRSARGTIPAEGKIAGLQEILGAKGVKIEIESAAKPFSDLSITVLPENFGDYQISLTPYLSGRRERKLAGISQFYGKTFTAFNPSWMLIRNQECIVVTNRAAWERETGGIHVSVKDGLRRPVVFPLVDLLMAGLLDSDQQPRIGLVSPKTEITGRTGTPVTILDGPEALKSLEKITTSNVIILLDRCEYNESVEAVLAGLASLRSDEPLTDADLPGSEIPAGTEMAIFAINTGASDGSRV